MPRPLRGLSSKGKLPAVLQAKLARTALRAARAAADNGKCAVAEFLFGFGTGHLQAASTRARGKAAGLKVLDAGMEATEAGKAILSCRERERAAQASPGATT